MISAETQAKLAAWRQKAREGTLTQEEMKEAIRVMRTERVGAAQVSAASKTKKSTAAAKKNISGDDLLSELDNL